MAEKRCVYKCGAWNCGSYQFNLYKDDIDQGELCDVHYWQTKAQPAQEPQVRTGNCLLCGVCASEGHKIQAKRPWVGLTEEEIWGAVDRIGTSDSNVNPYQTIKDARAIEAKLKEKNFD
jgi:hypothetical protein